MSLKDKIKIKIFDFVVTLSVWAFIVVAGVTFIFEILDRLAIQNFYFF